MVHSWLEARTRQLWHVPDEDRIGAYLAPGIVSSAILTVSHVQDFVRCAQGAFTQTHRSCRRLHAVRGGLEAQTCQQRPMHDKEGAGTYLAASLMSSGFLTVSHL